MTEASTIGVDLGNYALGWSDEEDYVFKPRRGLDADIVREMSFMKKEPEWMLNFRLKSLNRFERRPLPTWGGELGGIDFDNIFYYIKPTEEQVSGVGRRPRLDQEHVRETRHPRGRAQSTWPG